MNGTLRISDMLLWQYSIPHSRLFRVVELTVLSLWSRITAGTVFLKMSENSKKINLYSEKLTNSFNTRKKIFSGNLLGSSCLLVDPFFGFFCC